MPRMKKIRVLLFLSVMILVASTGIGCGGATETQSNKDLGPVNTQGPPKRNGPAPEPGAKKT